MAGRRACCGVLRRGPWSGRLAARKRGGLRPEDAQDNEEKDGARERCGEQRRRPEGGEDGGGTTSSGEQWRRPWGTIRVWVLGEKERRSRPSYRRRQGKKSWL